MTLEEIRELIKVVTETGVAELEVQRGENRVRIRRVLRTPVHEYIAPGVQPVQAAAAAAGAQVSAAPAKTAPAAEAAETLSDPNTIIVKSPIVGTFYESPSPGAASFVRVGDTVRPGDVLCIIESMKLMNEIEAEVSGSIVTRFVNNAQAVEYGEALFAIRPA